MCVCVPFPIHPPLLPSPPPLPPPAFSPVPYGGGGSSTKHFLVRSSNMHGFPCTENTCLVCCQARHLSSNIRFSCWTVSNVPFLSDSSCGHRAREMRTHGWVISQRKKRRTHGWVSLSTKSWSIRRACCVVLCSALVEMPFQEQLGPTQNLRKPSHIILVNTICLQLLR